MTYAISAEIPSPRSSPRFSLHSLRQQMDFVAEHLLEELALGRPHRIHVGLNVEVHGRAGVLVTQDPLYRLRVYFHLHHRGGKRVAKIVKSEAALPVLRDHSSFDRSGSSS